MSNSVNVDFGEIFREAEEVRDLKEGEAVFHEGDPGDCMYVILAGQVEIRVAGKYIDTLGPGNIVGEMALLDDSPRSATIMALEPVQLVSLSQDAFLSLIQETPGFAINVMRVMADRLRGMNMLL